MQTAAAAAAAAAAADLQSSLQSERGGGGRTRTTTVKPPLHFHQVLRLPGLPAEKLLLPASLLLLLLLLLGVFSRSSDQSTHLLVHGPWHQIKKQNIYL